MNPDSLIVSGLALLGIAYCARSLARVRRLHARGMAEAAGAGRAAAMAECEAAFIVLGRRLAQTEATMGQLYDLLGQVPGLDGAPVADEGPPIVLEFRRPADGDGDCGHTLSLVD